MNIITKHKDKIIDTQIEMVQLSPEQEENIRDAWKIFDKDNSGSINP